MVNTNHPSVAFIMPNWGKISEQFFMRQISLLKDANMLKVIIITGYSDQTKWKNIPIISLQKHSIVQHFWHYLKRKIKSEPYKYLLIDKTKRVLNHYQINTLLIQYGTTAVVIKEALDPSMYRIFVHVHGFDTEEQSCPVGHKNEFLKISPQLTIICNSKETHNRLTKWGVSPGNLVVKHMDDLARRNPGRQVSRCGRPRTPSRGRHDDPATGRVRCGFSR